MHLVGQGLDHAVIEGDLAGFGFHPFGLHRFLPHALEALHEHVAADDAQHDDVGDLDDEVGVAHGPQALDEVNPHGAAEDPADDEQDPHLEVDVAQAVMGVAARSGGRHDLVGIRGRGHRGGDARHDQQRGHEKAAAHAEEAGEEAHRAPQAEEQQDVDAVACQW